MVLKHYYIFTVNLIPASCDLKVKTKTGNFELNVSFRRNGSIRKCTIQLRFIILFEVHILTLRFLLLLKLEELRSVSVQMSFSIFTVSYNEWII